MTLDSFARFTKRVLEPLLAGALVLSVAAYYLLSSGKANNFPTYLMGVVALLVFWRWAPMLVRSWTLLVAFGLCAYLMATVLWSEPQYDEEIHSIVGNFALVVLFLVSLVICQLRFVEFRAYLMQAIVGAASLSALVFLAGVMAMGDEISSAPLGRWMTPSVGAMTYGFACVIATNLAIATHEQRMKLVWLLLAGLLAAACVLLRTEYVFFALLASLAGLALGQLWRRRDSRLAIAWVLACFVLMIAVILSLNVIIDQGRQLIWSSVLDLIYKERLAIGFGIRSQPDFHIACDLAAMPTPVPDCEYRHPHNLYVSTMFYGGIVGIMGLVFLMITSMGSAFGGRGSDRWLAVSTLTYGFAVLMFDGNRLIAKIDFVWLVFWLPVALSACLELAGNMDDRRVITGDGIIRAT